ncbi:hypothetical protein ACIGZJ_31465 [Kitasatospora sp. NPDC052868]|uniref:hypothetical protein n=1 Tax=Kitasatospora sp. NPDC052868 TaxID=3364060 RepID=UPI0037CB54F3
MTTATPAPATALAPLDRAPAAPAPLDRAPVGRAPAPPARAARPQEGAALAALLAAAFQEDPLTLWAFPDEEHRRRILPAFFRVFLDQALAWEGVLTTDALDTVLLFLPPGAWEQGEADGEAFAARLAEAVQDRAAVRRLEAITRLQAERHPRHRPHYYVSFAAAAPGRRRTGAVSVLLHHLLERVDAEGRAVYTEASSPGGAAAARRGGFTPFGEAIALPGGGPQLRPMWRGPR